MLLGCIADEFTGATDLASTLTRRGMACVQYNGLFGDRALADLAGVFASCPDLILSREAI